MIVLCVHAGRIYGTKGVSPGLVHQTVMESSLRNELVTHLSVLVREVIGSFDNLVKNHRHLHNLAGTRVPAAVYASYDAWINARTSHVSRDLRPIVGE
ncbi:uncharacterized protein N7479_005997 [Penicillium vulpinum]|uniref:uncharacterized protein n=1 Tax=Penicillium vulpinum TaxID=29845 RepID=UPI002548EFF1|nr:uncharacterized protein N7479_005997 [Penicillium vulpinum]KAJ5958847.1 hypothetical protein N7479_005997 [Penicillium vulpinum]